MSASNVKKNDRVVMLQKMASAAKQYLANKTAVLHGKPCKTVDFVDLLQGWITAMQEADALRASWAKAVANNNATYKTQIAPAVAAMKVYVTAQFGPDSVEYDAFGFTVPKQRSLATKVAAAALTLATRAARHTMGKKQRQAIKGVVSTPASTASATPSNVPATSASQATTANQPASTPASISSSNGSSR